MTERLDRIVIVAADPLRGRVAGMAVQHLLEISPGRDIEIGPVPLTDAELGTYAAQWNASLVLERDALAAQVDELTAERTLINEQLAAITAERDALAAELDAIKNPPGPDLTSIEGAKTYISGERFKRETGGISIEGQVISTERDETGHWIGRFFDARAWLAGDEMARGINPTGMYPYKPKRGEPVTLSAQQVVRAYLCMAWYINACFAVEDFLYQQLKARIPIETVLAAEPDAWPSNQFKWEPPTE